MNCPICGLADAEDITVQTFRWKNNPVRLLR